MCCSFLFFYFIDIPLASDDTSRKFSNAAAAEAGSIHVFYDLAWLFDGASQAALFILVFFCSSYNGMSIDKTVLFIRSGRAEAYQNSKGRFV
jgi:hypothetical protein